MNLRKGMWVIHADGIAIVSALTPVAAEIHFVDAAGITVETAVVPLSELSQAKLSNIPASRRPDKTSGAKFGYC